IVEVRVLRQEPDAAPDVQVSHWPAQDARGAGGWIDQLHQQLEGGALPCPVRAEESEDLALLHGKRERVERAVGPRTPEADGEILGQALCFNRRHVWFRSSLRSSCFVPTAGFSRV